MNTDAIYVSPQALVKVKQDEGKMEMLIPPDGVSPASSTHITTIRLRPSPLQIKRSLSNVKSALKGHGSTNAFLNKLGLNGLGGQLVADRIPSYDNTNESIPAETPHKAAKLLGETPETASFKDPSTAGTKLSRGSDNLSNLEPSLYSASTSSHYAGSGKRHRATSNEENIEFKKRIDDINRNIAHGGGSRLSLFFTDNVPTSEDRQPLAVLPEGFSTGTDSPPKLESPSSTHNNIAAPSGLAVIPSVSAYSLNVLSLY